MGPVSGHEGALLCCFGISELQPGTRALLYLLLFLSNITCFLLLPLAPDFSTWFDLLFRMCFKQKLQVRTHQRLPSSACPVSGQAVPLLQAETLPGMDFLSLADRISCCCCEPGKKLEVRDVLRARAAAARLQRCKMACGDLHQGGRAGLKASLLRHKDPKQCW